MIMKLSKLSIVALLLWFFPVPVLPLLAQNDSQDAAFPAVELTSTNLPLILIGTGGRSILDEPKIDAQMKVIDNGPGKLNRPTDPPTDYDGRIAIEVRGHHSAGFPQQPFDFETRDEAGKNLNVSLLGFPAENDWILLSSFNEKSFVRTTLAFDLFRSMGHYAPRARLCEVMLNGSYRGIYVFTEQIKRDKNRVCIAPLTAEAQQDDELTGGYIIKVDYHTPQNSWESAYHPPGHPEQRVFFVYVYPKPEVITPAQKAYIRTFVESAQKVLYSDSFADSLTGWQNYFDIDSFIDYFIVSEVSRNVDAYKKSRFFYKDRDSRDGRLHAGPVWDFDWAWKNITEGIYANTDGSGWSYTINDHHPDVNPPGWTYRLLQDAHFTRRLIDRYFELRKTTLSLEFFDHYIDSVRTYTTYARGRHFTLWPINRANAAPEVEPPSRSYDEEIARLREWIRRRIAWLDTNIPKLQAKITAEVVAPVTPPTAIRLFPSPASEAFYIEAGEPMERIEVFDLLGRRVLSLSADRRTSVGTSVSGLPAGLYSVRIHLLDGRVLCRRQIVAK